VGDPDRVLTEAQRHFLWSGGCWLTRADPPIWVATWLPARPPVPCPNGVICAGHAHGRHGWPTPDA